MPEERKQPKLEVNMINELSKGIGEALNAIVEALLEMPAFQQKAYVANLKSALSQLDADSKEKTLSEVTANLELLLPDYPLIGEVRARLEGMLYTKASSEGGVGFALPTGSFSLEGKYSKFSESSKAGSLAVELTAAFNQESSKIDWQEFRDLRVSDFLEILGKCKSVPIDPKQDEESTIESI